MRRMGGWLGGKANGSQATRSLTAIDEPVALQEAMASAALMMNDEMEKAEEELIKGITPFHKLGRATCLFLRAAFGFEKEMMEQAGLRIAEAEESALEHQRRATHNPSVAHSSKIYPVGSEYALCHAETQLMAAVVGVLNESLTESLKGFYKLRKAFNTLYEISEAEKKYMAAHGKSAQGSRSSMGITDSASNSGVDTPASSRDSFSEDDDDVFEDARDESTTSDGKPFDDATPLAHEGRAEYPDMEKLRIGQPRSSDVRNTAPATDSKALPVAYDADSKSAAKAADESVDFRSITSDPIDLFIHSGTSLCFGLLQLLLSLVPPAFSRILSLFSFRGDRETGLRMLWSATRFKHNINGAMAGMIVLGFHNAALAFCDIISPEALPTARLRALLKDMRDIYPNSKLWMLEEARMLCAERRVDDAVELLQNCRKSSLRQIEALATFETSLALMYLGRYQECADSFIRCVGQNDWSHALYYYIAGACHLELYRLLHSSDSEKAEEHATTAEKYFREVPSHASKKRFMGRQLPFDVFVIRKLTKWEARAKARHCRLADAVGVSPVVEMTYFWSGFRRMREEHLETCLQRLAWSEEQRLFQAEEQKSFWTSEPADEKAILHFLRGTCQRFLGRITEAKTTLKEQIFSIDDARLKACDHPDTWPLPVAHYEMAVCLWQEAGAVEGQKELLKKCSEELTVVERWGSFELDARIGMKIATARETLKKYGVTT